MNRSRGLIIGSFPGYDIKSVVLEPGAFESVSFARLPDSSLSKKQREIKRKILAPQENYKPWELMQIIESTGDVYFGGEEDHTAGVDSDDAVEYAKGKAGKLGEYQLYDLDKWYAFRIYYSASLGRWVRITLWNRWPGEQTVVVKSDYGNYWSKKLKRNGKEDFEFYADVKQKTDVPWELTVYAVEQEEPLFVDYMIESDWVPGMPRNR